MNALRRGLPVSVAGLLAGGALALLAGSQAWLKVTVHRTQPLPDVVADLHGRTVEPATAGIGVVALAAAVAVIATAGLWRRIVGAIIVAAGAALVWRSTAGVHPTSARVLSLVSQHRAGTVLNSTDVDVTRVVVWPLLSVVAGVLVVLSGVLTLADGHRWTALSSRYEAPTRTASDVPTAPVSATPEDRERARSAAAAALWSRVDRGDDPTLE